MFTRHKCLSEKPRGLSQLAEDVIKMYSQDNTVGDDALGPKGEKHWSLHWLPVHFRIDFNIILLHPLGSL